jgi:hypothetical protein
MAIANITRPRSSLAAGVGKISFAAASRLLLDLSGVHQVRHSSFLSFVCQGHRAVGKFATAPGAGRFAVRPQVHGAALIAGGVSPMIANREKV